MLYDWLVVFFVHEILQDQIIVNDSINNILNKGCHDNTIFFLIRDSIIQPPGSDSMFFKLSISMLERNAVSGGFTFTEVNDFKFDNLNKNCWRDGFQYVFSKIKCRRRILITLSHGSALGIDVDKIKIKRAQNTPLSFTDYTIEPNENQLHLFSNDFYLISKDDSSILAGHRLYLEDSDLKNIESGYIKKDSKFRHCRSLEILWINDLADTLCEILHEIPVDIVLMVNCFMQSFDAGYILRNQVEYLIAPEASISSRGYDYPKLLEYLKEPGIPTESLVEKIVLDYKNMYRPDDANFLMTAVFGNHLKKYKEALSLFENFIVILDNCMDKVIENLVAIRNDIMYVSFIGTNFNYHYPDMIDVFLWINLVLERLPEIFDDKMLGNKFGELLGQTVVAKFVGNTLAEHDKSGFPKLGFNGISLFYPTKNDYRNLEDMPFCGYFDKKIPSAFRRDSSWTLFLNKYYSLSK